MTPELWQRAKEVLAEAQELDSEVRESFLAAACMGDGALRAEVDSLLEHEPLAIGILDGGPLLLRACGRGDASRGGDSPSYEGRRIGPYRVEQVLAEGGMGTVALAVREDDFRQRVALKLVKRGELSEELLSRFHIERQILANLKHPGIAAIYDAGTTEDGVPYFAMEYVEGERIDRYCEVRELSVRERLELFRQVCSAVQLAHQNLVVHRDLKPGNILVTTGGVPKLIDFGIAKPLSDRRGSGSHHTGRLARLRRHAELAARSPDTIQGKSPMTIRFASPEQVRGEPITTATDIYSLGVLLFVLLTGESPYPPDSSGGVALAWVICNVDPRRPSRAIRRRPRSPSAESTTVSQPRHPSSRDLGPEDRVLRPLPFGAARGPRRLRRRLAGDLDSIVLKALRKDPGDRYSSVEQLSADVRRHLAGLPVIAREGGVSYRAAKYVRRNRWRLAVAAVLILVLGSGAMMKIRTDRRLERAKLDPLLATERANDAASQAEMLSDLLKNLFSKAFKPDEARGQLPTAPEILARGKEEITRHLAAEPALLATQLEAMGMVYQELGHFDQARPMLEESLRLRRRCYDGDHPLLARGLNNLAAFFYRTGEDRRAEILYHDALRMKRRLGQEGVDLVKPMSTLATILMNRGEYAEAEEIYRRALEILETTYGRGSASSATGLLRLGALFYVRGDFERAEPILRQALDVRLRDFGPRHTRVASARSTLGRVIHAQGRLEEAERHFTEVLDLRLELLGEDHLQVAFSRRDVAALRLDQENPAAAESLLAQALRVFRRTKPEDSWVIADAESLLGACWTAMGRYREAEPLLRRSYLVLGEKRGEQAVYTRRARRRLDELYAAWGGPADDHDRLRTSTRSR